MIYYPRKHYGLNIYLLLLPIWIKLLQTCYYSVKAINPENTIYNYGYGNRKALGVFITKNANHTFSYQYVPVDPQNMVFLEKMYLMPIPSSEISKNKNLVQNTGWSQINAPKIKSSREL